MLFWIVFLIELELVQHGSGGRLEFPLFEIDAIAVRSQPDTENVMFVEDQVAFLLHPEHIVHPCQFGVLLIEPGQHLGTV